MIEFYSCLSNYLFFTKAIQLAIEKSSKIFLLFALLILSGVLKRDISETPGYWQIVFRHLVPTQDKLISLSN